MHTQLQVQTSLIAHHKLEEHWTKTFAESKHNSLNNVSKLLKLTQYVCYWKKNLFIESVSNCESIRIQRPLFFFFSVQLCGSGN